MSDPVLPKDPEQIRAFMIKWHGEREAILRRIRDQASTGPDQLHFWAIADVHDGMEQFWEDVVFEDLSIEEE